MPARRVACACACVAVALALQQEPTIVGTAPSEPRPFLRLLDGRGGVDRLPAAMAAAWPTWILDADGAFERVPGAADGGGWVDAVSVDDVWCASDLEPPTARLALGIHVRDGTLRHLFPAVDLAVRKGDTDYRNRGLRTMPRAHAWLAVGAALPSELRLFADGGAVDAAATLARAVEALADAPPAALGTGSHVVHAVVAGAAAPSLVADARLQIVLADALYDAADPADADRAAELDVLVLETAPGGASDHLPATYRDLYRA